MTFDYNTTRPALLYAEYGRNIQNMVKFIKTLPTKDERNKHAQAVIDLMGFLNPHLRDVADFKHKLWDHLFIIADFDLDVDSPYPIPSKESLDTKPKKVPYPMHNIHYKHYGKTVELMIAKARSVSADEPERRSQLVAQIANFMKMSYVTWNKDTVSDETIISDLKKLSNGELEVDENTNLLKVEVRKNTPPRNNNFKHKNNNTNNNNNNNNNNRNKKNNQSKHRY
jgi:hypothetical protein